MKIEIMKKIVNSISDSEDDVSFYKEILKNYDNLDEKIKEEFEKNNYNEKVYRIAINQDILKNRTIEEQIEIMKNIIFTTHSNNLEKIKSLNTLKEYINQLETKLGPEQDILLEDVVPIYKKQI